MKLSSTVLQMVKRVFATSLTLASEKVHKLKSSKLKAISQTFVESSYVQNTVIEIPPTFKLSVLNPYDLLMDVDFDEPLLKYQIQFLQPLIKSQHLI
jgi:hypothetical protein